MQMLATYCNRAPAIAGTFFLLLATALTGCASKNPLMEQAAPVTAKTRPVAAPVVEVKEPLPAPASVAEEKSAPTLMASATSAATANTPAPATSVQTKQEKRFLGIFRPYRPDIQQGNFVTREMVAQLKPGMTQDQVVFLLGSPLLNDVFHADRWDYAFRMQRGNGEVTTSRVTVFFKDKLVSTFEGGGDLPTEKDYLNRIADKAKAP